MCTLQAVRLCGVRRASARLCVGVCPRQECCAHGHGHGCTCVWRRVSVCPGESARKRVRVHVGVCFARVCCALHLFVSPRARWAPREMRGLFCASCGPAETVGAPQRVVPRAGPACLWLEAGVGSLRPCGPSQHSHASQRSPLLAPVRNTRHTRSTVSGRDSVCTAGRLGKQTQPVAV